MPSQILVKAFQSHTSLKANTAEGQGHVPTQGSPWRKSLPSGSLGFILAVLTVQQRPLGPCWCAHHLGLDSAQARSCCKPTTVLCSIRAYLQPEADNISFNGLPVFSVLKLVLLCLGNRGSRGRQSLPWRGVQRVALFRYGSQGISS